MNLEELRLEVENLGYKIFEEEVNAFGHTFLLLLFEDGTSIDRVKMSMNLRNWEVIKVRFDDTDPKVKRKMFLLHRDEDVVELNDFLLSYEGRVILYLVGK